METGLLAGMLLPISIFFMVYLAKDYQGSFLDYLQSMWQMQALVKLGSLCVFANVGVFWLFLNKKYEKAARGVLGATILYAMLVIVSRTM